MAKIPALMLFSLNNEQFSQLRNELFLDHSVKSFLRKFKQNNKQVLDFRQKEICAVIEEEIRRQAELLTFVQYARMVVTDNWTDVGQERMVLSLTRLFQKIAYDQPISYEALASTKKLLKSKSQPFLGFDEQEFDDFEDSLTINLGWKKVSFSEYKKINIFLESVGSDCRIIMGQLELYSSIIFGKAVVQKYSDFEVYTFKQELIHTPAIITSIAAMIKEKEIIIREASAETIFFNKWADALAQISDPSLVSKLKSPSENVSLAIKLRALLAYEINSQETLKKKKKIFIKEILEGLLWHEIGHGITLNHFFSSEQVCLDEALSVLGETSSSVAKELLADWAIASRDVCGPLWFMLEASQNKCNRMLMVYLSDNWFLTANDNFFKNHTEILLGSIIDYFDENGNVRQQELFASLPKFYREELATYRNQLNDILVLIEDGLYQIADNKLSFAKAINYYEKRFQKHLRNYSMREKRSYVFAQLIMELEETNSSIKDSISKILDDKNGHYHQLLQGNSTSTTKRVYLQMKRSGFILSKTVSLDLFEEELTESLKKELDKVLVAKNELEIADIVGDNELSKFFYKLFYLAGYSDNQDLSDNEFREAFNRFSFATMGDSFADFGKSNVIDYSKLFGLIFSANFRHLPEILFLKY